MRVPRENVDEDFPCHFRELCGTTRLNNCFLMFLLTKFKDELLDPFGKISKYRHMNCVPDKNLLFNLLIHLIVHNFILSTQFHQ